MGSRRDLAVRGIAVAGVGLGGAAAAAQAIRRRRTSDLLTGQVMSAPAVTLGADSTLSDAAEAFASASVGSLPVCDGDGRALGVVTDRDLVVRVLSQDGNGWEPRLSAIAEKPAVVADIAEPIATTAETMRRRGLRRLPVVSDGRVVGVVSRGDLVRHLPARASRALHQLGARGRDGRSGRWLFESAYT